MILRKKVSEMVATSLAVASMALGGCGLAAKEMRWEERHIAERELRAAEQTLDGGRRDGLIAENGQVQAPANGAPIATTEYQQEVLAAQQAQARKQQVTVTTRVFKLLRDDRKGLPHERFLIKLNNDSTVLIAHDIKLAPYVPLRVGDWVTIHGEYIWNAKGGVIHWTHHDPRGHHDPGWIDFNGQRYQ